MSAACEQSKQKHWLVKATSGERFAVGKSLPKRSGAVPLGCHEQINKRALIGRVQYPTGSRGGKPPSVNGALATNSWNLVLHYYVLPDHRQSSAVAFMVRFALKSSTTMFFLNSRSSCWIFLLCANLYIEMIFQWCDAKSSWNFLSIGAGELFVGTRSTESCSRVLLINAGVCVSQVGLDVLVQMTTYNYMYNKTIRNDRPSPAMMHMWRHNARFHNNPRLTVWQLWRILLKISSWIRILITLDEDRGTGIILLV